MPINNPRDGNFVPTISGVSNVDTKTPIQPIVHSVTQRLYVDSTTDVNTTSIVQDGTTLTTGTNVAIQVSSSSITCKKLVCYAYTTNRDTVAVGTSTVIAESSSTGTRTGRGEQLIQGAATAVLINDVSKVWISAPTNGDGISWIAYS